MRRRGLWFHVIAIMVEQATVLLVPAFSVWWVMLKLGCPHALAAILSLSAGFMVSAVIWSAAEIAELRE